MLIALHKPYGVVTRFSPGLPGQRTLAGLGLPKDVYPIGRLDADSEGLLLLSDEKDLADRLLDPERGHPRTYWVQVEGVPNDAALARLAAGVLVQGRRTRPCRASRLPCAPAIPPRDPPIRFRKSVPDSWIEMELVEGRNRQVRRMTAAVGHPTLRLVRARIGRFALGALAPGTWREIADRERRAALGSSSQEGSDRCRTPNRVRK